MTVEDVERDRHPTAVHPMGTISTRQNLPRNIQRLAAQRRLYSCAKGLSTLQLVLAGLTSIAGGIALGPWEEALPLIAFAGIVVSLVNIGWLERWQHRIRRTAADIQEEFDCNVLDLPWNDILAPRRPAVEDINEEARKATPASDSALENWYPTIVDSVAVHQARVICQRINCQWDSRLRRRYGWILWTVFALIILVAIFLGVGMGMDMQTFVLAVAVPLSPTLLWGMREAQRQYEAAAAIDQLGGAADTLWTDIVENDLIDDSAASRSRELQNAILFHRRANAVVYDWFYRLHRERDERGVKVRAEDMVAQVNTTT